MALVFTLMTYLSWYRIKCLFIPHTIERGFRLRRAWVKIAFRILNIKLIEVKGELPPQPCLYVVNHRNLIDPVICAHIKDAYFLSKAEVENIPFLGKGAELTGVIYVKRDEKDSRSAARATMHNTMKAGLDLIVYPEGTTGTEEKTITFHKGSFDEAASLGVPVVPIALEYKNKSDLWIEPSLLKQFLIQFGKKETQVKIEIHQPLISDNGTTLMRKSRQLIDQSLQDMHKDWHQLWGTNELKES
ncbi:lysophospholipid acyltransferase family protein [Portibacter lacus]|uniref:lysophospholipid acyltransferase family protein n=1 Tax=Portibacter lacus TaxID=1099794 RepID=UPI001F290F45|nr:lysophospholipid acyltransferase family protein [Portibacter lacus]